MFAVRLFFKSYTFDDPVITFGSSSLHQLGTSATRILEASRKQVAELIGKSADEIFFTSGGTEGDNWVIKGVGWMGSQKF